MLVQCLPNDISVKNLDELNKELKVTCKQEFVPLGYTFDRTVGLRFCPNEHILAILTQTKLILIKTSELYNPSSNFQSIALPFPASHLRWTGDTGLLIWSPHSVCLHYSLPTSKLFKFEDVACCTSAIYLNSTIILTEVNKLRFYDMQYKLLKTVDYKEREPEEDQSYLFNVLHVYEIVKLNNLGKEGFEDGDVYALIGVFYAEPGDPDNVNSKVIYFLQGDIMKDEAVRIRYGVPLFTNMKDNSLFYNGEVKRGFTVRAFVFPELKVMLFGFSQT